MASDLSSTTAGSFETLPKEIRLMIWQLYLKPRNNEEDDANGANREYRLSAMRTCKLIHHEIDYLLHNRLQFSFRVNSTETEVIDRNLWAVATLHSEDALENTNLLKFSAIIERLPLSRACRIDLDIETRCDRYDHPAELHVQVFTLSRMLEWLAPHSKAFCTHVNLCPDTYATHRPDLEIKLRDKGWICQPGERVYEVPAIITPVLELLGKLHNGTGTMVINNFSELLVVTRALHDLRVGIVLPVAVKTYAMPSRRTNFFLRDDMLVPPIPAFDTRSYGQSGRVTHP